MNYGSNLFNGFITICICWAILVQLCFLERVIASKANIIPVKLLNRGSKNRSSVIKHSDHLFGSVAKISRVVPVKHILGKSDSRGVPKGNNATKASTQESLDAMSGPIPSFYKSQYVSRYTDRIQNSSAAVNPSSEPKRSSPILSSWDYLNSIVSDDELKKVMNELSEDMLKNVTSLTKINPRTGQKFLLRTIINQLSHLKLPRMLDENLSKNTGVRFSGKRKPVLNIKPPEIKTVIGYRNISGHISNGEKTNKNNKTSKKATLQEIKLNSAVYFSGSTTPTLMQVLGSPEANLDSTTFTPSVSADFKHGFLPIAASGTLNLSNKVNYEAKSKPEASSTTLTVRKPRGPPEKEEYMIPFITSTEGPESVSSGYQTIGESSTSGPKVVWYNHNQTPEDTFYPNSDGYLVPPEEALSIEIITDLSLPPNHQAASEQQTSFIPSKLSSPSGHNKNSKKSPSQVNGSGVRSQSRGNPGSLFSNNENKLNKNVALQPAASSDHDGIRDFEDDYRNGGRQNDDHESRRYPSVPHKQSDIPHYQEINGNPADDSVGMSYGVKVYDHYHDSYPGKHDISQHHSYSSGGNNYRGAPMQRPHDDGYNGNYGNEEPSSDPDYGKKPEKSKESLPAWGWGSNPVGNHGGGGWGKPGNGWKDQTKDFFTKAKDYFKNSDLSTSQKWFDLSIGILAFLAFGGYIIMLLYQVFTVSSATPLGNLLGRSFSHAEEIFDIFFSKGPIGQAYMDELETIVKRAMANVKRIWMTHHNSTQKKPPKVKGEVDAK